MYQVRAALNSYYFDNGSYPPEDVDTYRLSDITAYLVPTYLPSIPLDPTHGDTALGYRYGTSNAFPHAMYTILVNYERDAPITWCEYRSEEGDPHWSNLPC